DGGDGAATTDDEQEKTVRLNRLLVQLWQLDRDGVGDMAVVGGHSHDVEAHYLRGPALADRVAQDDLRPDRIAPEVDHHVEPPPPPTRAAGPTISSSGCTGRGSRPSSLPICTIPPPPAGGGSRRNRYGRALEALRMRSR